MSKPRINAAVSPTDPRFAALGHYGGGQGGPEWGWRTEITQPDDDTLVIAMFNIEPDGSEMRAVETLYSRAREDIH